MNSVLHLVLVALLLSACSAGLTKLSLQDLAKVDVDHLSCESPEFPTVRNALLQWQDAMQMHNSGQLQKDLQMLQEIKLIAKAGMEQHDDVTLIEGSASLSNLLAAKMGALHVGKTKHSVGGSQVKELQAQIEKIMNSDDPDDRKQCCAMLYGLVEYLINEMEQLQQCCAAPIVININGTIERLEVIGAGCEETPLVETPPSPTPEGPKPDVIVIPKEAGPVCVEGASEVTDSAFDDDERIIDTEISGDDLKGVTQYGYGLWIKFTTHYPGRMYRGKQRDQYIITRLTHNKDFKDKEMGDRTLVIFLGRGFYDFYTHDVKANKPDVRVQLPYGDIEGVWVFMYFSYVAGRATAFLHQPDAEPPTVTKTLQANHIAPTFLRFILGGKDRDLYEGFNGQINRPLIRLGRGSYIDSLANFNKWILACNPRPHLVFPPAEIEIQDAPEVFGEDEEVKPNPVAVKNKMPEEYAAGGWFKWAMPLKKREWAIAYRVTIIDEDVLQDDVFLGDRDLTVFIQKTGTMRFATYNYENLDGVGNPNVHKDVKNCYKPGEWHYIYTGYSRPLRRTYALTICGGERIAVDFPKTNHFLSQKQTVFVAKDPFHESYTGTIAKFTVKFGEGAFDTEFVPTRKQPTPTPIIKSPTPEKKSTPPKEKTPTPPKEKTPTPPKEKTPEKTPTPPELPPPPEVPKEPTPPPPPPVEPKPKTKTPTPPPVVVTPPPEKTPTPPPPHVFENVCIEGSADVLDAAHNGASIAEIDIADEDLKDSSEYGYGFWLRFLTRYPVAHLDGLNKPYYFIARLTENVPNKNDKNLGDRTLATFFSQTSYHFATYNAKTNEPNVHGDIEYPKDIEGVWNYLYFSYSSIENRGVAYVVFTEGVKQLDFKVEHNTPSQLRLILAGTDGGNYPGFNGQFARPILRVGEGAYLGKTEEFTKYARKCNPAPGPDCTTFQLTKIIDKRARFKGEEATKEPKYTLTPAESKFPSVYSLQGWFKWAEGAQQQPWHTMYRMTLNSPAENENAKRLGDRTLAAFVGTLAGGVIAFSTYSYDGVTGTGNPNVHQSIPYHDQLTRWHYVYFLYEREHRSAFAEISFRSGKVESQFVGVNHFLAAQQYIYVGRDQFYPSYNGYVARFKVNTCGTKYNPEIFTPTPPVVPGVPKEPTPVFEPKTPTPPPPPPAVTPPIIPEEICLGSTPYIEVNNDNIDQVIKLLQAQRDKLRKGAVPEEDLCYCSFAPKDHSSLQMIQLAQSSVQQLLFHNRMRLRL